MALSTGLYMLMYMLLFLAALKLKRPNNSYKIPRGTRTLSFLAGLGACLTTIIVGFQPSPDVVITNKTGYSLLIAAGFSLMIGPVFLLWKYQKKNNSLSLANSKINV